MVIFRPKYQGYSLGTFWPKHDADLELTDFNLQIEKSIQFQLWSFFGQNTKVIALLFWPKNDADLELTDFNLQIEKSIQFQFCVIFGLNTKVIALLFWPKHDQT